MPPRRDRRYLAKLLGRSLTQRTLSSSSTTTRHHLTASGTTTQEVPRQRTLKPRKEVTIEPLLDAPQEEEAIGVSADGTEDPVNTVHDPEVLEEDQTQVSLVFTYSRIADLENSEDKAVASGIYEDLTSA
jgi:hypothetical protein